MEGRDVVVRLLGAADVAVLAKVAPEVFDDEVDPGLAREFLNDPRHAIAVAIQGDAVVGFASGVRYVHPDKPSELFVNEVSVAPPFREQGLAKRILECLLHHARELGCHEAWVATEPGNEPARALYRSLGGRPDRSEFVMYTFPLR